MCPLKEKIRNVTFKKKNADLLVQIDAILKEYAEQDIRVTLRQLYYQLVARELIPNTERDYKKISTLVTNARYGGYIDWNAIVDRTRLPSRHPEFRNILDLVRAAEKSYRLPRWEDQEFYLEMFTEKDALSPILSPITRNWHIYLNVNRGYCSATAMHSAAMRFVTKMRKGKRGVILYIGDHDPSGVDMVRDIRDRFEEFFSGSGGTLIEDLSVNVLALTQDQIHKYGLPPNPAKESDPRAEEYIRKFGGVSWEADALPPQVLIETTQTGIKDYVDLEKWDRILVREENNLKALRDFGRSICESIL
jgi:hypothetical protein